MTENKLHDVLEFIQEKRVRISTGGDRGILIASESDKGRVVNSAAFRRLQQKAQVFPLDTNAAVRTRLTHSIEVSQVGRHIAQKIIEKCSGAGNDYLKLAAFVNTVETACLLHDIGNPPFGHLGEAAIKEWFKSDGCPVDVDDLKEFDGNPQGFRLVSLLSGYDSFGLNLTCAQLLSIIKYPWGVEGKPEGKKIGLFSSDFLTYKKCCDVLGWEKGKKFPLLYLMEAADDIAYSMSDLEDGLEKNILSIRDIKEAFPDQKFDDENIEPFVSFKTNIINNAVEFVSQNFLDNLDKILRGEDIDLLSIDTEAGALLDKVKNFARKNVYSHESAEKVELAGRSIIKGLLNHFKPLLQIDDKKFMILVNREKGIKKHELDFHIRMFNLLPKRYVNKYLETERGSEEERRAHLIVDFIAGMTDDFALETYQILEGIRIK